MSIYDIWWDEFPECSATYWKEISREKGRRNNIIYEKMYTYIAIQILEYEGLLNAISPMSWVRSGDIHYEKYR